jgi:uncharacterized protein YvpB
MKIYFAGRHVRKTHQFMLDKKANILYSYHELTMSPFSKEEIKNIDDLRKVKNEKILNSTNNSV